MRPDLPTGTVTFLFTDVEGSTKLLHAMGAERYAAALAEHRRLLREAFTRHGGVEVDTQGDAFFFAFPTAPGALNAAAEAVGLLRAGPIRVRIGIHTGTPMVTDEGYVGVDVHRAARIAAAGHGGQVLISATAAASVSRERLRDLGEHRLKDLTAPERIFQLGDDVFGPLKTLHATNLPIPTTPFIGRGAEVDELATMLARDEVRLLTLTGPGGTGKTRLALQAAAAAADGFPDGVWWVALAALRDPSLVVQTAAAALGAPDALADHIADKRALVVLDNFEQVIDAASDLASLLARCPRLTLFVTSREALRIEAEWEHGVDPLASPEATDLFVGRAVAVNRRFRPSPDVARLCERLDNLPLAIELAAARTKMLSVEAILERLDGQLPVLATGGRDTPDRQRTLHATIAWSHDLLRDHEQRLFARLAVFRGGWTLDAAEVVADAELDSLQSLVDKSLVRARDDRFSMLETIREYAAERLDDSPEADALRARHASYFAALAERADAERATAMSRWLRVMELERDNVRAALDHSRGVPREHAALAGAVATYWVAAGHVKEARDRLAGAIAAYEAEDGVTARAYAHLGSILDADADARPALGRALTLYRTIGDPAGEALVHEYIGLRHVNFGRYDEGRRALEESLRLRSEMGAPEAEGLRARGQLCHVLVATGKVDEAEPMAATLWDAATAHGAHPTAELAIHFTADCALLRGKFAESEELYRRALTYARQWGLVYRCTDELLGVAMATAGQGEYERAVRFAAAARAEDAVLGFDPGDNWWNRIQDRMLGPAWAALGPERAAAVEAAAVQRPFTAILDEVTGSVPEADS